MNNEEIKTKIVEVLKDSEVFTVLDVDNVNYKPHPYCITQHHLSDDSHSPYLGEPQIMEMEKKRGCMCGMYVSPDGKKSSTKFKSGWNKCQVRFEDHTSDKVCFIQLKRHATQAEAQAELKKVVEVIGEKLIDGFGFVESEEKFRID